jgi:AAA domain
VTALRKAPDESLPTVRASDLADLVETRPWLVASLWGRAAVGILGGAPKCCKSWLALDLAVSVASRTPCLGRFAVDDPGTVLLYMAEDSAAVVKARLAGLCFHRGLRLDALPIHVITAPAVRIDQPRDQQRLRRTVGSVAPRLLVLDPFVRLHRVDENDAGQVSAVLGYLRSLQRDLDAAVLVVHHARKNGAAQAGQALRGSGDLHAWGDSNLYLRRHQGHLTLTIEHRAAMAPEPVALHLVPDPHRGDAHLALVDPGGEPAGGAADLEQTLLDTLAAAGEPLGRTALRDQLRVRNQRLGEALHLLARRGAIVRVGERWAVPVPPSTKRLPNFAGGGLRRSDDGAEHAFGMPFAQVVSCGG